jgi:Protein of unknown function (DUF3558)
MRTERGSARASSEASATTPVTTPSLPPSSAAQELPPRPREIDVNGLDLCTLWTPRQLAELDMPARPASRLDDQGKPWCYYDNEGAPDVAYGVKARLDEDVTEWLGRGQAQQTSVLVIGGFPAVELQAATTVGCAVLVSNRSGQYLQIQMTSSDYDQFTIQQMCGMAKKAATFAAQTLQTLR